jgi:amphiphysin
VERDRTKSTSGGTYRRNSSEQPPPPYSPPPNGTDGGVVGKKPPPPAPKPAGLSKKEYVTALYDYTAQADGDLSFKAGDKIEIVEKGESGNEWWIGRLNGAQGQFPANYTQ